MRALTLATLSLLLATPAVAQDNPCGPSEPIMPWSHQEVGTTAVQSVVASGLEFELCSAASGLGDTDGYRALTQIIDGDFYMQTVVLDVDAGASVGLVAVGPAPSPDAARFAIEVVGDNPSGTAQVRASMRAGMYAPTQVHPQVVDVDLPVTIRLRRVQDMIRTELEDGNGLQLLLTENVAGTPLMGALNVGPFSASNDAHRVRRATVTRVLRSEPVPEPAPECIEPRAMMMGGTLGIRGENLGGVHTARIGDTEVPVARDADGGLLLTVPEGQPFSQLPLSLIGTAGTTRIGAGVGFSGKPYVRGDADGDGTVDREDWRQICYQVHRSAPLSCQATGDVDGDRDVDAADLDYLRRYLSADGPPPVGPFPKPGLVDGALSCGLPAGPSLHAVTGEGGKRLRKPLATGDVVELHGEGFPTDGRARVLFGLSQTQVLGDSTSTLLRLRVGRVEGQDGRRCPVIWDAPQVPAGQTRHGQAFTPEREDDALCPQFAASRVDFPHFVSSMSPEGRGLSLSLPRESFPEGQMVRMRAELHLPFVDGRTRGPRSVVVTTRLPTGGRVAYEQGMQQLADELGKALQGQDDDECECEYDVQADPFGQQLLLAPCLPEPTPPKPAIPGLPTQVQSTRFIVGGIVLQAPPPTPGHCDVEHDYYADPLAWSWCQMAEMLKTPTQDELDADPGLIPGVPRFESLIPYQFGLDNADFPGWQLDVAHAHTSQKRTLWDDQIHTQIDNLGYGNGCNAAMRGERCTQFMREWMPRFKDGGRVVKPFFVPAHRLPQSVDPDTLYKWEPKDMDQPLYLVGLHVNVATEQPWGTGSSYFRWITAWMPPPIGVGESCDSGTANERPVSLSGTPFDNWMLCNPDVDGQAGCGNPWAPIDECSTNAARGCRNCHANAKLAGDVQMGWLFLPTSHGAQAAADCKESVEADPNFMSSWGGPVIDGSEIPWATCESSFAQGPVDCYLSEHFCTEAPPTY